MRRHNPREHAWSARACLPDPELDRLLGALEQLGRQPVQAAAEAHRIVTASELSWRWLLRPRQAWELDLALAYEHRAHLAECEADLVLQAMLADRAGSELRRRLRLVAGRLRLVHHFGPGA